MRVSPVRLDNYPRLKRVYRAAKAAAPFAAAYAAVATAHYLFPPVRDFTDQLRAAANDNYPRLTEAATAGFMLGWLPDRIAQQYEGQPFNLRRSFFNTLLGAGSGVFIRLAYDGLNWAWPGEDFVSALKKMAVDQFGLEPPFVAFYVIYANFVQKKPWHGFGQRLIAKYREVMPLNWAIWIPGLLFIFTLPKDLQVYATTALGLLWRIFMNRLVYDRPSKI